MHTVATRERLVRLQSVGPIMKYVGVFVVLFVLFGAFRLTQVSAQDSIPDISGEYTVSGDGSKGPYTGTAIIAQKGQAVFVTFITEDGKGGTQGFGMIRDGYMVYGFPVTEDIGLGAIYKIDGDKLLGTYIEPDGTVYPEVMTKGNKPTVRAIRVDNAPR